MSISDFSISSPRKGRESVDKSLTYEEEFVKYLDGSDSESLNYNPKKSKLNIPKWLENDVNEDKGTKSFIKKPKDSKPNAEQQSKPINEMANEEDDYDYLNNLNEDLPKLSLNDSSISTSTQQIEPKPRTSLERRQHALNQTFDNDLDETRSTDPKSSSRLSQHLSPVMNDAKLREQQNEMMQLRPFHDESNNKRDDDDDQEENNNLLSKVMFAETLETGTMEKKLGANTLTGILKNTQKASSLNEINNEAASETMLNDESSRKLNTQARNDLEDMEKIYSNYAIGNTPLNSMMRTNTNNNDMSEDKRSKGEQMKAADILKSNAITNLTVNAIREELERRELERVLAEIDSSKSEFKAAKTLKQLNQNTNTSHTNRQSQENNQNNKRKPTTNKYENIRGTGYGKPAWSPKLIKRPNSQQKNHHSPPKLQQQQPNKQQSIRKSSTSPNQRENFSANVSINGERFYMEEIHNLSSKLIQQSNKYENDLKELHDNYEKQIKDLKAKIIDLTNKLNEENDHEKNLKELLSKSVPPLKETNKEKLPMEQVEKTAKEYIEKLEKTIKEQESLITGYQNENEKLYTESKAFNTVLKQMQKKYDEENQKLKLEIVQERMEAEKRRAIEKMSTTPTTTTTTTMTVVQNEKKEETNNFFLPTREESEPSKKSIEAYESQLRQARFELNESNERVKLLVSSNQELKRRLEYYEKNQQQIEVDIKVIESKNNEIKKLNDRLKLFESGRNAPDCMRQIKRLENQLRELDLTLKRYKKPSGPMAASAIHVANMTLDYYEKRIDRLEEQIKEKTLDLERFNRMWEQKLFLCKQIYEDNYRGALRSEKPTKDGDELRSSTTTMLLKHPIDLDKKLRDIESKYLEQLDELKQRNQALEQQINEHRTLLANKNLEIDGNSLDYAKFIAQLETENKQALERVKQKTQQRSKSPSMTANKPYEPNQFRSSVAELIISPIKLSSLEEQELKDSLKQALAECEHLRKKCANMDTEMRLKRAESDMSRKQLKQEFDKKLVTLAEKHRNEMEILVRTLTGTSGLMTDERLDFKNEWDSPLNDTLRMRYMLNARDNFNGLKQVIEKQKRIIADLVAANNSQKQHAAKRLETRDPTINCASENEIMADSCHNNNDDETSAKVSELIRNYEYQLLAKNKEIERFRNELDTMLKLLETLRA